MNQLISDQIRASQVHKKLNQLSKFLQDPSHLSSLTYLPSSLFL